METHAVIIPTYNERENIGLLVDSIVGLQLGSRIIVVDDNSPDGTGELADELPARYNGVRVIHRSGKLGLGTAHIAGMKAALSVGMACILALRVYQLAEQSLWFDERNPLLVSDLTTASGHGQPPGRDHRLLSREVMNLDAASRR